ncbi:Universal stress protein family protein [Parasphingorhabdus marina DSM 22363]|uniref:Universal stress protein family protein n=2 Tax=Parasphingorhabdus marina TaxID=394732 RepID=A0A1N6CQE5_9SPHN|nr:Universal stress protein family protein [Parasphingorhabdus marina DSM 22363]
MKSVLLHINDDPGLEARLQAALDLTRAVDGHLHCLRSNPYHPQMAFDGVTGMSVMYDIAKMTYKADEELWKRIEKRLADEDVSWDYSEENADASRGLTRCSALMDIIVLSSASGDWDSAIPLGILGEVLFDTRVPLLVQPDTVKKFNVAGPAVVAWNGSFEAGNALRSAIPLLKLSSDVHIVTIAEDKDHDLPPLDACEYLSRHGIKSEVHEQQAEKSSVDTALLSTVETLGAGYLVMGAYGHGRARQFLFGGVTRSMFKDSPVPLIVSH